MRKNDISSKYNMGYIWAVCLVAAMGGLLFGYDWVVIGGAKPFYEKFFNLTSSFQVGWAMSSALVGCLLGAVLSGGLSDRFGRKRLLILAAVLFTVTSVGTATSGTFSLFILCRVLGGVGIGLASNLSPIYIAEVSPAGIRGMFVSINQLTIVIGVLSAQMVNWLIAKPVPVGASSADILNSWNGQTGWRWMFGATAVPALIFFFFMFLAPESPRWLVKNGKDRRAMRILTRIGGDAHAAQALAEIKETLVHEVAKVNFRDLLDPKMMKVLRIGVVLAVFQQWCGINVIFNYAEEVFSAAGYHISGILQNIVITGVVMLVFTFVAIFTVDRLGRRILMLAGSAGLAGTYILIGACYQAHMKGIPVLLLVVTAIACYSFSLAPITWVILSEIFPNRIRGAAMSVSVFALWFGCFTLTYTFPLLNRNLGPASTFWIYALICVAGFFFVKFRLPETKGKSLEEIERELVN
jgi:SP family sugar porter-like MFS transporter